MIALPISEEVDWFFHRIAASKRYSSGLHEIRTQWSLIDLLDAHEVLDAYEYAEREALK